jgi:hypothetical protein
MNIRNIAALLATFAVMIVIVMGANTRTNDVMDSTLSGEASEGFQLSAGIENKQFRIGEPIVLKLTIRNSTKQVLYLTETSPESDYKLLVKNEYGERVPLTEFGQRLLNNKEEFRVIGVKVKSGEERKDSIEVSRLHEMTVPGTYSITASRTVKNRNGKGWSEVVSNTINITIVR